MDNRANEAYLTAIINGYERQINKVKSETVRTNTLKEVVGNLGDLLDFISDKKAKESKSTLELNKDLKESARAYKETITEQECTITTLAMDLREDGYKYDKEIKDLKSKLNITDKQRLNWHNGFSEVRKENYELKELNDKLIITGSELGFEIAKLNVKLEFQEIENGKYVMEIQDLKTDNKIWQAQCIELRDKLEKATKCQWWID